MVGARKQIPSCTIQDIIKFFYLGHGSTCLIDNMDFVDKQLSRMQGKFLFGVRRGG